MKMNYAAQSIAHVYKNVIKEKENCLSKLNLLKVKESYGNFVTKIDSVFTEFGDPTLKYEYVGFGGLVFLGNINGKVATNGLYYKSKDLKQEVETFIKSMDTIYENETSVVNQIREQHGTPKPEYSVIYNLVKNNKI